MEGGVAIPVPARVVRQDPPRGGFGHYGVAVSLEIRKRQNRCRVACCLTELGNNQPQEDKSMVRLCAGALYMAIAIILASGAWNGSSEARVGLALQSSQAMNFTVEGKIDTLGENKFTLSTEENMIFHVRYDNRTEFKGEDGSPATSKDLRAGREVRVEGDLAESGEIAALRIELLKSPAKK